MNNNIKPTKISDLGEHKKKQFLESRRNYEEMMKKIAPFIKPRKIKRYSTAGQWCEPSCYDNL